MALFYEATTSGLNFDRFTEDLFGDSTKLRMKQAFWSAKQLLREKMGKREDEHILAADAELDLNLQQFYQIKESTKRLLDSKSKLHREFSDLSHLEFDIAELFFDCKDEKKHLQRVMQMTANSFALCAKERQNLLLLIARFYHELNEFYERAVLDCAQSVEAVEKARLDYRGSLLWMKKCSDALDPELRDSNGLE
uniref:AH domain-containing protein n=1 Tax=Meloidogyne incognita TaxID=6306 RepID=A0A914NPD8_MELIC